MEWSAERRAAWLYNHQAEMEHDAYMRGLRDAEVAREIQRLEKSKASRDPNYVDPTLRGNEDIMYTQDHVDAMYNPEYAEESTAIHIILAVALTLLIIGVIIGVVAFVATKRFGE